MTYRRMVTTTLFAAAIGFGLCLGQAAPASADNPDPLADQSNPYRTFTCSCTETAPAGSPVLLDEIHRGLERGHTALLPGLPAPAR
ncbi:hypothetical protein [Mycobacterium sp. Marseille-P9652]|uniref:hypothetical protein n=1 Tax=Mycobacterium sp. Marseille-P9652 TaxID=2654950 RepID=UPI0012E99060|nr:hypothetical protein [Mycobacterium sp. Marseille-P9652]